VDIQKEENALEFTKSEALTFGLELEFQIVNEATGRLSPSSLEIWKGLADREDVARFSLEATLSTMEINSSVHTTADAMAEEVHTLTTHIQKVAREAGLNIRGGGTQMSQFWNERIMAPTDRARELETKFGFLPKRFSTYGMHVHIGMTSGDEAIRVGNLLQCICPLFIAMSAASPFLQLADTGFAAARPLETLMYPHGGPMPELRDWAHFEEVAEELFSTQLASTLKDIYWDVRPKPEFGTVEIRVFDTPLSIKKAVALAAFARVCASLALDGLLKVSTKDVLTSAQRVSRFLACRDGMGATLFNPFLGEWMPARAWLEQIFGMAAQQPIYAIDTAQLDFLQTTMRGTEDHETMRLAWASIQGSSPNPEERDWILPRYSSVLSQMLN
jgi:carboxylate-amine ligase